MYRRADVELVLRIKQLVFGEGLTLAGVRRRLEEDDEGEAEPSLAAEALDDMLGGLARSRLQGVREGLEAILRLLDGDDGGAPELELVAPAPKRSTKPAAKAPAAKRRRYRSRGCRGCRECGVLIGCSAAWLARLLGVQEVPGSNPGIPTS